MLPARHAVFAPLLALFTSLLVVPACGGGGSGETAPTSSAAPSPARSYRDSADDPVADDEQGRSGWRWRGKRQDCFYRHQNHCYDNLEAACAAARCRPPRCIHDSSAPSVVSCRK